MWYSRIKDCGRFYSNQVHPPQNNVAVIPSPPEDIYFEHYSFEQVWQFQQCDAGENGYYYIAPDEKVFFAQHASQVKVVYLPVTSTRTSALDQNHSERPLRS